jgi:hypothetical protein
MTPKEKAKELVEKFRQYAHSHWDERNGFENELENSKHCSLITVEETLTVCPLDKYDNLNSELTPEDVGLHLFEEYWYEVKKEIELL